MLKVSKWFQGIFAILFGITIISVIARGYTKYSAISITIILLLGILFSATMVWFYNFIRKKTFRMPKRQITKIFFCIAAAVLVLQLFSAFVLKFKPISDLGYVDRAARDFCQTWNKADLYSQLPAHHKDYFVRYTNNQALLVILSLIYSTCQKFFGVMPLIAPILINTMGLHISYILCYFISGKIFKDKFTPLFCAIIGAAFSVFYTYTPYFYTDSMSMPFVMGAIYLFLCAIENNSIKSKIPQILVSGLLIVIGYKIKGSVIILIPAFIIYLIFTLTKANFKEHLKVLSIFMAGIIISTGLCSTFINSFDLASKTELEETQFPPEHWVMMGLHDRGGFYIEDFWFTVNSGNYEQKKQADVSEIKNRISEYGFTGMVKHLVKKISYTWGDGTYFVLFYLKNSQGTNVFKEIVQTSIFKGYCSVYQCMLLLMILFSFINGATSKKYGKEIFLKILICGVYFFFIIWETRSRYLVNFSPIFIITASYSIKQIAEFARKRYTTSHKMIIIENRYKNVG